MGVRGLQTFIENQVPEACIQENIGNVVQHTDRSNVLIIDLMAMVNKTYEDFDYFNGGDFIGFKNLWKDFIATLEKAGVKIIFVCDGVSGFEEDTSQ